MKNLKKENKTLKRELYDLRFIVNINNQILDRILDDKTKEKKPNLKSKKIS